MWFKSSPYQPIRTDKVTVRARFSNWDARTKRKVFLGVVFALASLFLWRVTTLYLNSSLAWAGPLKGSKTYTSGEWDQYLKDNLGELEGQGHEVAFNATPLRQHTESIEWVEGLNIFCPINLGGLANVINMLQNCFRYSISAGVTGIVLPEIKVRDTGLIKIDTEEYRKMDYLFDLNLFRDAMWESFPKIRLYNGLDEVPGWTTNAMKPNDINLRDIHVDGPNRVNNHSLEFLYDLKVFLKEKEIAWPASGQPFSRPLIVRLAGNIFEWQPYVDPPAFNVNFARLLRLRKDCRALGWIIIKRLTDSYMGVHLRTEIDAQSDWPKYDEYAAKTVELAPIHDLKRIFVATGDEREFNKFRRQMAKHGLDVQSKYTLLTKGEQKWMRKLTFDQEAEVDYVVMSYCKFFLGTGRSTFSTQLAIARHLGGQAGNSSEFVYPGVDGRSYLLGDRFHYHDNLFAGP